MLQNLNLKSKIYQKLSKPSRLYHCTIYNAKSHWRWDKQSILLITCNQLEQFLLFQAEMFGFVGFLLYFGFLGVLFFCLFCWFYLFHFWFYLWNFFVGFFFGGGGGLFCFLNSEVKCFSYVKHSKNLNLLLDKPSICKCKSKVYAHIIQRD